MNNIYYPSIIERSEINSNSTLWLPEQEGLIESIVDKYGQSQGYIWHALICAAADLKKIDLSSVYIEPEGDVFVCYAKYVRPLVAIAKIITELLDKKEYMLNVDKYAEKQAYYNKF